MNAGAYFPISMIRGSNAVGRMGLRGPLAGIPTMASHTSGTVLGNNSGIGIRTRAANPVALRKRSQRRSPRGLVRKYQAFNKSPIERNWAAAIQNNC